MEERVEAEDKCDINPEWLKFMAKRENFLCNEIPHYPILVEHIREYTSQPDYEDKFLKTIQTVGEIIPDSERWGKIVTPTNGRDDHFPVNFDKLKLNDLYIREPTQIRSSVWEKYNSFKVFGTLERRGQEIVLELTYFKPVQNIETTLEVMTFLSRIAQCTHEQFGTEMEPKKHLRDYWNTSKLKGKRFVQQQDI